MQFVVSNFVVSKHLYNEVIKLPQKLTFARMQSNLKNAKIF